MSGPNVFWSGFTVSVSLGFGEDHAEFVDVAVPVPCTLIRSLVWATFSGYNQYSIGSGPEPIEAFGWAFADQNSVNHSTSGPSNVPGWSGEELIASDVQQPTYAALGWPPNVHSDLSGSVNDIESSATIDETWNLNAFMYASARSFVDSHAQRHFEETPHYGFTVADYSFFAPVFGQAGVATLTWRGLYHT